MKNMMPKLIKRFIKILFLSSFLFIILNLFLLGIISFKFLSTNGAWGFADDIATSLLRTESGYQLSNSLTQQLHLEETWAILIDNETRKIIWQSENLPAEIPMEFSISDIATISRSYLKGYPTFTGEHEDGLIVLGTPKESDWKLIYNSWDLYFIENVPIIFLIFLLSNVFLCFIIYAILNRKLLKSVTPLLNGIEALPDEKDIHLKEDGLLSEIATHINRTAKVLQAKNHKLKQKETARANWIAGVSHDIRTPLSMVMGYAGQLENDKNLPNEVREKAKIICSQSLRMKNLIYDLNLASKLEYNMQPIHAKEFYIIPIIRQVVADFINSDIQCKYPIEWNSSGELASCKIYGDVSLIKRALINLIQNSQNHNTDGCNIFVEATKKNTKCMIHIFDNGIGVDEVQLDKIRNAPHYMICNRGGIKQQHGLGILIVKQIVAVHKGNIEFNHSPHGGFAVIISLPLLD